MIVYTTTEPKLCWNCTILDGREGEENEFYFPQVEGMFLDCCDRCGSGWFDNKGQKLYKENIGELYNEDN